MEKLAFSESVVSLRSWLVENRVVSVSVWECRTWIEKLSVALLFCGCWWCVFAERGWLV